MPAKRKSSLKPANKLRAFLESIPAGKVLVFIVIVYVLAQASIDFPTFSTTNPLRDDDIYGYLLKAAQMESGCVEQDCPALSDLHAQFTKPSQDPDVAGYRNRVYHRLFVVYHPLHSAAIVGLHGLGIDYEIGYDLIAAIAKVAMPLAVAYFIYTVWGAPTTIVSLLLLTPTLFSGSGIHIIKMHVIVLSLAMVLWANIYKDSSRAGTQLFVFSLVMGLIHPLGKLLGLGSLVLYLCLTWPLKQKQVQWALASGVTIAILFIAPSLITAPELDFDPVAFYPGQWDYFTELVDGLKLIWMEVSEWAGAIGGWIALLPLSALGLWSHPERKKIFFLSGLIAAVLLSGLVYVVPWYGTISFPRVWPLAAIFLTAAFAAGLLALLEVALQGVRIQAGRGSAKISAGWLAILPAFIAALVLLGAGNYLATQSSRYLETAKRSVQTGDFINRQQLRLLEQPELTQANNTVLYMDELALHYYMTYGALDHGAIYYTALRFTPDLDAWLQQREGEIAFVVNRNPLMQMPHDENGMILLENDAFLRIDFADGSVDDGTAILLGERATQLSLKIAYQDLQETKTWVIEAGETGWFLLPEETAGSQVVTIRSTSGESFSVGGLRFDEGAETLWPWDRGLALTYNRAGEKIVADLLASSLAAPLDFEITVMDDRGLFLLGRIAQ